MLMMMMQLMFDLALAFPEKSYCFFHFAKIYRYQKNPINLTLSLSNALVAAECLAA